MRRQTRHILAGLIIGAALLTTRETRVGACSCIGPTVACESVWTSDAVFVATVLGFGPDVETTRSIGTSITTIRERIVRLKVSEAFRGMENDQVEVRTSSGSCTYVFKPGGTYLVYAYRSPNGDALLVSYCSRTAPIEQAADDLAYLRGAFRQPAELGTIRGVVTRQDPGLTPGETMRVPFAGADLRLEGYARAYTAESAGDGTYQFLVPAGDYRLLVSVREGVYSWPGPDGHPLTLRDNRGCAVADVIVRPDSRIAGRLLDDAGRPLPFMSVELVPAKEVLSEWLWSATRTLTDARGHFEFSRIDPGQYALGLTLTRDKTRGHDLVVWLDPSGGGQPVAVTVASEARLDAGVFRLPPGVSTVPVYGVVVDSGGKAVRGAEVRFLAADPNVSMLGAPAVTDKDGHFSLSVVTGRSYRVSAAWQSTIPGAARYLSAESAPFDAVGEPKPFRLVLTEVR